MKKSMMLSVCGLAAVLLGTAALAEGEFPVTVQDALGNEITLEEAPKSIVSLSPAATEIVFAVGAGGQLTGRTDYCNYPEGVADVDSIGTYTEPNLELILSKTPDLVLASDYIDDAVRAQLEEAGAAVCLISANSLEGIEDDILTVGELTGNLGNAEEIVDIMEAYCDDVTAALEVLEDEEYAFIDLGYFYSAGPGSLLDETLAILGINNVCEDADTMWPAMSVEAIIEKNPDIYISLYSTLEDLLQTPGLEALECLQDEAGFVYIDGMSELGDKLQRPGPRYMEGVYELAELLYPDLFAEDADVDVAEEETEESAA